MKFTACKHDQAWSREASLTLNFRKCNGCLPQNPQLQQKFKKVNVHVAKYGRLETTRKYKK
jgi:hypothetical protein